MGKKPKRLRSNFGLASLLLGLVGLTLHPMTTSADAYHPRSGWSCLGSTSRIAQVIVQVIYQATENGTSYYRVRQANRIRSTTEPPTTALTVDAAVESENVPGQLWYSGTNGTDAVELQIRKVDGSDQNLSALFRATTASGNTTVPQLFCNRTRF